MRNLAMILAAGAIAVAAAIPISAAPAHADLPCTPTLHSPSGRGGPRRRGASLRGLPHV